MNFHPLHDRILVRPIPPESQTASGLHLPAQPAHRSNQATVLAVGPGRTMEDGTTRPVAVDVGDLVMVARKVGVEIELDGQKLLVVREEDVLGALRDAPRAEAPHAHDRLAMGY